MDGDVFWGPVFVFVFFALPAVCVIALVVGAVSPRFRTPAMRVAGVSAAAAVSYVVLVAARGGFE